MGQQIINKDDLNLETVSRDLEELARTPGPTQSVAKISEDDPRLDRKNDFPITQVVKKIIKRMEREKENSFFLQQHHGNLILVGGLEPNPKKEEIQKIPVTLAAHLDEISYFVKNEIDHDLRVLIPLCAAPRNVIHQQCKIYGFRGLNKREFVELGDGRFSVNQIEKEEYLYSLKTEADVKEGDLVIQNYGPNWAGEKYKPGSILNMKALDDRVGCAVLIHAVNELGKRKIPSKAILTGGEEGVNRDVAWARLARQSFRDYCRRDGVAIICDGVDGAQIKEFPKNSHVSEALIIPYTSHGKGAGDPGLFSLLRDCIVPVAQEHSFEVTTLTDYVSRSIDPKIMDEFPLIGFVDWCNGKTGDKDAKCHYDESIAVDQLLNIVGVLVHAVMFLYDRMG